MRAPQLVDSFLPADLYKRLREFVEAQPMQHGAKSNGKTDPHGHWSWKPFTDSTHNLADIAGELVMDRPTPLLEVLAAVRAKLPGPFKLIRCYVNGYAFGDDGYFHTDSDRDGDVTAILYICDSWDRDWAGETVMVHDGIYFSYLPVPNRALLIASATPHAARAVSRKCTQLRRTLMFKLRPQRSMDFERLSQFLVSLGAHRIGHARGSLHDHLVRVYELLEKRNVPSPVAYGGGLHSIYGTNSFKTRLLAPCESNRAMVAGVFGKEAEDLAWRFSLLDRPLTLDKAASRFDQNQRVMTVDQTYNTVASLPYGQVRDLCLIECANLVDQGSLGHWAQLSRFWNETKGDDLKS